MTNHRWAAHLLALFSIATTANINCKRAAPSAGGSTSDSAQSASASLAQLERSGALDGVEIEYYVGGGLPPPYYRSDQLRFLVVDGIDTVEYATPHYDSELDPYPIDKYRLAAEPGDIRRVARLLRETHALDGKESQPPEAADMLRFEIAVRRGGVETLRTFHGALPTELAPLQQECERLVDDVKKRGARSLYYKGQPIIDAGP